MDETNLVLKYAHTGPEYQENAKEYVVNMCCGRRKLHRKNGCYNAKCLFEFYDFDTLEEALESNVAQTVCGHCFATDKGGNLIK